MTEDKRYLNSKIYKIVNSVDEKCFIGTTILSLKYALGQHFSRAKCQQNQNSSINLLLKGDNVDIILIEYYPCSSFIELKNRKRYWLDLIDNVNAIKNPIRTIEDEMKYRCDYYNSNTDKCNTNTKTYYDKNRESIRADRNRRIQCSHCVKKYNKGDKVTHYRDNHAQFEPPKIV
jgi:hypothetical protein